MNCILAMQQQVHMNEKPRERQPYKHLSKQMDKHPNRRIEVLVLVLRSLQRQRRREWLQSAIIENLLIICAQKEKFCSKIPNNSGTYQFEHVVSLEYLLVGELELAFSNCFN